MIAAGQSLPGSRPPARRGALTTVGGVAGRGHLRRVLAGRAFRDLLTVRLLAQLGDGIFQASLAGAVLFDPERAGHASDVASAFAVLLLPYSVIGPFAGVLLDRWSRQRILLLANAVRAVLVLGVAAELAAGIGGPGFYASGLVIISVARFVLAALSAALPRVVAGAELVTANAANSTLGTIAAAVGGGLAIGVRAVIGDTDGDYAVIAACSLIPYALAAVAAMRFARGDLGPSADEQQHRETPGEVVRGLLDGTRAIARTPIVAEGLAMIGAHRLLYGVWTVCTVLLYRNWFPGGTVFPSGLAGLSQVVAGVAIGGGLASFVTPAAFRRFGAARWPATMLVAAGVIEVGLNLPYRKPLLLLAALLLAFVSQSIKISIDTVLQHDTADRFRGRVFAIYDMLFNVALVVAAVLTAVVLPEDGHSPVSVVVLAGLWVVLAAGYVTTARRTTT
jgi:hypothetical protein